MVETLAPTTQSSPECPWSSSYIYQQRWKWIKIHHHWSLEGAQMSTGLSSQRGEWETSGLVGSYKSVWRRSRIHCDFHLKLAKQMPGISSWWQEVSLHQAVRGTKWRNDTKTGTKCSFNLLLLNTCIMMYLLVCHLSESHLPQSKWWTRSLRWGWPLLITCHIPAKATETGSVWGWASSSWTT